MTYDLGNNETAFIGIAENTPGIFTVITMTRSKDYKSYKAAIKCLAKWGYDAEGKFIK